MNPGKRHSPTSFAPEPPRLPLAQLPTPLAPMSRLQAQLGLAQRLWVKRDDLSGVLGSGNKLRKLEYLFGAARAQHCQAVITCGGVQSNHCRATAVLGARLGFAVHLVLRGRRPAVADGNLLLAQLVGAATSFHAPQEYREQLPRLLKEKRAEYERRGMKALVIPIGGSDLSGMWGYVRAAEELRQDMAREGIEAAEIICATGSGGTQAGLIAGAARYQLPARIWGVNVCEDARYFERKISADLEQWQARHGGAEGAGKEAIRILDAYAGPAYGVAPRPVWQLIRLVARTEGLVLDPVYTGKALYGMVEEARRGRFDPRREMIFLHSGGVYGLFPQRQRLWEEMQPSHRDIRNAPGN